MTENKKIKKLEKVNKNSTLRFKKTNLKPSRCQAGVVSKPARIATDHQLYQLESDLIFAVKDDQQILFDVSMLNFFKYITSVEIRKDLKERIVTLLLENKQQLEPMTWSNTANDLEMTETPELQAWAESLKTFGEKHQAFLNEFEALKKETNMQKKINLHKMRHQVAQSRLYILSSFPAFEMRYRMKKDEIKCTELCFNETFLKEAGYNLEHFTSAVLTEGLPQLFPQDSSTVINSIKGFMDNYMESGVETPEQETELLMKSGYRKKITFQTMVLKELSEGDLILSFIFYMKMKSLPFGAYRKEPYSPDFLEILKSSDKEKEYLFNTYYGENFQGLHSNTERVCKIKEIPVSHQQP